MSKKMWIEFQRPVRSCKVLLGKSHYLILGDTLEVPEKLGRALIKQEKGDWKKVAAPEGENAVDDTVDGVEPDTDDQGGG